MLQFQLTNFRREKACSSPLTGAEASSSNEGIMGANSRPHSSTSAELETGMSALTVQPQPAQQSVSTRTKENRFLVLSFACLLIIIPLRKETTALRVLHNSYYISFPIPYRIIILLPNNFSSINIFSF